MSLTTPIVQFNRVLGRVNEAFRLPGAEAYMRDHFGGGCHAETARKIFEAHKARIIGESSPAECDAITERLIRDGRAG